MKCSVEVEKRGRDKAAVKDIEVVTNQKGDTVSVEARRKDTGDQGSYGSAGTASRDRRASSSRSPLAAT